MRRWSSALLLPVPQKILLSARMAIHMKYVVLENHTGTRIAKQARMESARGADSRLIQKVWPHAHTAYYLSYDSDRACPQFSVL